MLIAEKFREIKVFLIRSGNLESCAPVAILEAQATGLPVISSYHADIPEVVVDGKSALLAPERDVGMLAKPITTTNVSDLHLILDGCGWGVEPENPEQLAETIHYVLSDPEEAEETGCKARQKCIDKYSRDAMKKVLAKVFGKYG